jgi:hypothetical protein
MGSYAEATGSRLCARTGDRDLRVGLHGMTRYGDRTSVEGEGSRGGRSGHGPVRLESLTYRVR